MNRQIPPPRFRFGTRIVLPFLLVGATTALLIGAGWRTLFPGVPVRVVPVMVKTVEGSVGGASVTATGWLEPDPYPYYATALESGTIEAITVLEGSRVEAGDVVARLVADDARIAVAAADADVAVAEGECARARAALGAERERLETLIARRRDSRTTDAAVAEALAELSLLDPEIAAEGARVAAVEDEFERKRSLVASGAVSAGEVRRLSLALEAERAGLRALRARRPLLDARIDRARAAQTAAAEQLTRTIDERLGVAIAEAEVARSVGLLARAHSRRDEAQLALDRTLVRAPVDGIVMRLLVAPGSRIAIESAPQAAHILHLYDPAHLQVRVDVPLADAAAVGVDQNAEVIVSVLPDHRFLGRVSRMLHEADLQKNTVEVKVAIEDPNPLLKPEMLARVRFLTSGSRLETRQRLLVPERCLIESGGASSVWVVDERLDDAGVAAQRALELGSTRIDGWREVTAGLQPGDWIIADPPANLEAGDAVTIGGEDDR